MISLPPQKRDPECCRTAWNMAKQKPNTGTHSSSDGYNNGREIQHDDNRDLAEITIAYVRRRKWWAALGCVSVKLRRNGLAINNGSKCKLTSSMSAEVNVKVVVFPPVRLQGFRQGLLSAIAPAWQEGFAGLSSDSGRDFEPCSPRRRAGRNDKNRWGLTTVTKKNTADM